MITDLVLFDMDGTIVQYNSGSFQSSWDALGEAIGRKEEWDRLLRHYINKPAQYQEWFEENCRGLEGVQVESVKPVLFPPPYTPGFPECCAYLKGKGILLGLVSSGVDLVAKKIQQEVGLDFILINELLSDRKGRFTGRGRMNVHIGEKGELVKKILHQYGIRREATAFIGDHFNDIPAWQEVGYPLGMNLKDQRCYSQVKAHFTDFYQVKDFLEAA